MILLDIVLHHAHPQQALLIIINLFYLSNHQQSGRDKGPKRRCKEVVIKRINRCCDERREHKSASGLKGEGDAGLCLLGAQGSTTQQLLTKSE